MNIAQGLKEKNRITGRISRLERQINQYNRYLSTEEPEFDINELNALLSKERECLIAIKTRISKANNNIVDKLVLLEETKSELAFWQNRFGNHGPATKEELIFPRGGTEQQTVIRLSCITTKDIFEKEEQLQKVINNLQDEIDTHNATTLI